MCALHAARAQYMFEFQSFKTRVSPSDFAAPSLCADARKKQPGRTPHHASAALLHAQQLVALTPSAAVGGGGCGAGEGGPGAGGEGAAPKGLLYALSR